MRSPSPAHTLWATVFLLSCNRLCILWIAYAICLKIVSQPSEFPLGSPAPAAKCSFRGRNSRPFPVVAMTRTLELTISNLGCWPLRHKEELGNTLKEWCHRVSLPVSSCSFPRSRLYFANYSVHTVPEFVSTQYRLLPKNCCMVDAGTAVKYGWCPYKSLAWTK